MDKKEIKFECQLCSTFKRLGKPNHITQNCYDCSLKNICFKNYKHEEWMHNLHLYEGEWGKTLMDKAQLKGINDLLLTLKIDNGILTEKVKSAGRVILLELSIIGVYFVYGVINYTMKYFK